MTSKTRFSELDYQQQCDLWRIVDSATGAAIGPFYRSKAELLADLERYATDYGCANAAPRDPVREAAPDLLAALELMQAALTEYGLRDVKKRYSLCVADAAASAAIAKARG